LATTHHQTIINGQLVISGGGCSASVGKLNEITLYRNVVIIHGSSFSFDNIKKQLQLPATLNIHNCFIDFNFPDEMKAMEKFKSIAHLFPATVIAVGGGIVIDMAKYFLYSSQTDNSTLIAIPATCGSGSEATAFAVLYRNGEKYSLEAHNLRPSVAVLDVHWLKTLPSQQMAISAADALCQALESLWSKKANETSQHFATEAATLLLTNITDAVLHKNPQAIEALQRASHLSGQAIQISRTTGAHALSYTLTSKYNVPHGEAVAMMFPIVYWFNTRNGTDTNSFKGTQKVTELLNTNDANGAVKNFIQLMKAVGVRTNVGQLHPNSSLQNLLMEVINGVNEERFANNPRSFDKEQLLLCFQQTEKL
jgi:alcohol dehydrogenase